jgi:uncharacterized protein with ParB-like and HNH nuclease domain
VQADNIQISKVFSSGGDIHYVLPHFQREYTWGKEEWTTLLNDALEVYDEIQAAPPEEMTEFEHFLGSVVVIPDGHRSGTMAVFKLVDGQQRLTTLTLMLQALSKNIAETHLVTAKKIAKLLVNIDEQDDLYFKILPTTKYGDRLAYTAILRGEDPGNTDSKIPGAFSFFCSELEGRLSSGLNADHLFLVLTNAFQVVFITLNQKESPYKIFESLNAKGKPLSQADLVRNYIAMKLPVAQQEKVFAQSWGKIEGQLQETRNVGRLGELTAFIRHYLALKLEILVDERHVYARFRDRVEKTFETSAEFEAELSVMKGFANHYNVLLRPETAGSPELQNALKRLNKLESGTAYPFLLALLDAHYKEAITSEDLLLVLATIENYMVRRYLSNESPSYLNKVFPSLWKQIDPNAIVESLKKVLATKNYPTDEEVLRELEYRKLYAKDGSVRARTGLVLDAINRKLSEGTGGYTVLDGSATIEHIMPQTLGDDWKTSLGIMWEKIYKDYLHTLGNLTLITGDWNLDLSNATFQVKKPKLSKHALRLNSQYFSQPLLRWGRDEIRERTELLGGKILELWPSFVTIDQGNIAPLQKDEASEFHFEAIEKVSIQVGYSLTRLSQARFECKDRKIRVVGLSSKMYPGTGDTTFTCWYGFAPSQREFLNWEGESWVALECGSPDHILFFPFSEFEPYLRKMNVTVGKHWHLSLAQKHGRMELHLPTDKLWLDVTDRLLQSRQT